MRSRSKRKTQKKPPIKAATEQRIAAGESAECGASINQPNRVESAQTRGNPNITMAEKASFMHRRLIMTCRPVSNRWLSGCLIVMRGTDLLEPHPEQLLHPPLGLQLSGKITRMQHVLLSTTIPVFFSNAIKAICRNYLIISEAVPFPGSNRRASNGVAHWCSCRKGSHSR